MRHGTFAKRSYYLTHVRSGLYLAVIFNEVFNVDLVSYMILARVLEFRTFQYFYGCQREKSLPFVLNKQRSRDEKPYRKKHYGISQCSVMIFSYFWQILYFALKSMILI